MAIPPRKPQRPGNVGDIRTQCFRCGVELIASPRDAGKRAKCPECGTNLTIPPAAARPEPPVPQRRSSPPVARTPPVRERLPLRGEPPSAAVRPPVEPPRAPAPSPVRTEHRVRANLVGWCRRVVIVVLALAIIKIFEAACASVLVAVPEPPTPSTTGAARSGVFTPAPDEAQTLADWLQRMRQATREFLGRASAPPAGEPAPPKRQPGPLHRTSAWLAAGVRNLPSNLQKLAAPRNPADGIGMLTPLERLILGLGMLAFAARLVVRAKLLDAVYVTTDRWRERTTAGLICHYLGLLLQAGILAWAASAVRMPGVSDGLAGGLLVLLLWTSALWMATIHLVAGNEYRELTSWMAMDAVFGLAILLVVMWPGVTQLWTRAGAAGVLFLGNSVAALHIGASFVFARRQRRWWWHKPLTVVISVICLLLVAVMLACVR